MFNETIHIEKVSDIRYGTTKIPAAKTQAQIESPLEKNGCQKTMFVRNGDMRQIAFEFEGNPYVITVPRVFVKGAFNDRIGIRLVLYYLEIVLAFAKERVINFEFTMLSSRLVPAMGTQMSVADAIAALPEGRLFSGYKPALPAAGDEKGGSE